MKTERKLPSRVARTEHTFAKLEEAADHAHLEPCAKAHVSMRTKARIATAFDHCIEATNDLERFLARAAADASDRTLSRELYDAAKAISELRGVLDEALASIDAFIDTSGTARGVLRRMKLEAQVALRGRTDALVVEETEEALLRAIEVYDRALDELTKAPRGFAELVASQRKRLSFLHRRLARRAVP